MRSVEVEGGSIDEAIERALDALGAPRARVEIDILENAARGLLGFGRRRARVRATMRAPFALGASGNDRGGDAEDVIASTTASMVEQRSTLDGPAAATLASPAVDAPSRESFDGAAILTEILRRMNLDARVRASIDGTSCALAIESTNDTLLHACRDDVLAALELVMNRIAVRHGTDKTRFTVTLGERRARGDLHALARRLAEQVRTQGKAVTVEALGERERGVVLEALRGERGVTVRTTGAEPQRTLVIIPGGRRRSGETTDR
jgi:spoIIIJ-associated protein